MGGRIEAIHIAERMGGEIVAVDEVTAVTGRGLAGDRIINEAGDADIEPKRQLTLIEAEALEALERDCGVALSAAGSRRNLCTRGVALNHLVGHEFRVGPVRLRGVELCEPCGTMERLSGCTGSRKGLIHRGGLRAEILEGGPIRRGDPVETT